MIPKSTKRQTRIQSEAVRERAESRSTYKPVIVDGISAGELITVTKSMFDKLDVDPQYQRGKTLMVGQIIRAIQAGGSVLDPVTLCQRPGSETMWVVDGHQRVCAFQETGTPFKAMLHKSKDANAEHQFFIALNAKRAVSANIIVKAWTGPAGVMLRKANESMEHPLYERVNFGPSGNDRRINASTLVNGMVTITNKGTAAGRVDVLLAKVDMSVTSKTRQRARVEHYLRLIGLISPSGGLPHLVVRALGEVAGERWVKEIEMPNRKIIEKLSKKNWVADTILLQKYYSVLLDTVRKIWKA